MQSVASIVNYKSFVVPPIPIRRLCTIVFNNPFESFHNTVSEAKKEREQLDRLLTISTPRERLLVAVIALLLVALAVWLVFGDVARSLEVEGVVLGPGEGVLESEQAVRALVWVDSDVAPRIKAGLSAAIELEPADGSARTLEGEIAQVAAVPVSESLTEFESAAPMAVRRIEIVLGQGRDLASLAGRECRIVIKLGSQSPVAFIGMWQP